MKHNLKAFVAGMAIIVLTNIVALGGVAYNRSGEPDAQVTLSEREIYLSYHYGMERDNKGMRISIDCRVESIHSDYAYDNQNCRGTPDWFNRDKLLELGFEFRPYEEPKNHVAYDRYLPKDVYLVLELEGNSYLRSLIRAENLLTYEQMLLKNNPGKKEFVERVERAREQLEAEQQRNSRLFVVDAGLDKSELRKSYPGRRQYILVKGSVKPDWYFQEEHGIWRGRITDLSIKSISVPLQHQASLADFKHGRWRREKTNNGKSYAVSIAYGKRAEPWLVGVEVINKP